MSMSGVSAIESAAASDNQDGGVVIRAAEADEAPALVPPDHRQP